MSRPHKKLPSVPTAEGKLGFGLHADLVLTPVRSLPPKQWKWAVEVAADVAFELNQATIAVGVNDEGWLLVCDTACCYHRPGVVVVVPDVTITELAAQGHDTDRRGRRITRSDGRSAYLFAGGAQ